MLGIPKPVIMSLAANGPRRTSLDHPTLPLTLDAMIKTAREGIARRASLLSFAVRDETGGQSLDGEMLACWVNALRETTDSKLLLQIDLTGDRNASSPEDRLAICRAALKAGPDSLLISLFDLLPRDGDETGEQKARAFLEDCIAANVIIQFACTRPSDIDWFYAYRNYGIIPEPCRALLFILGEDTDRPQSDPHHLRAFLKHLDLQNLLTRCHWSVAAFGPQERLCQSAAMALGGHCTVGPAYNDQAPDGVPLAACGTQLEPLEALGEMLDRPAANLAEARLLMAPPR